jgi:hypothetical protein
MYSSSSSSGVTISSNEPNSAAGATFWLSLPKDKTSKQVHFQLKLMTYQKYILKVTQSFTLSSGLLSHTNPSFSDIHKVRELFFKSVYEMLKLKFNGQGSGVIIVAGGGVFLVNGQI